MLEPEIGRITFTTFEGVKVVGKFLSGSIGNDNLTTGVWVDASATAVDTGYNTGVGNQNLKGYVFTTDVGCKGIRIEGQGFDAYSISALPEPGAITLLALGGLGVLLRRRRRA